MIKTNKEKLEALSNELGFRRTIEMLMEIAEEKEKKSAVAADNSAVIWGKRVETLAATADTLKKIGDPSWL